MQVLTREELKKIKGGEYSGCGVKVNGVWHPSGLGAGSTQALLGANVVGNDPNWFPADPPGTVPGSSGAYTTVSYSGMVTNWCCDSCWWKQPVYT